MKGREGNIKSLWKIVKPWCQPVEVGCRGFAGQSVWKTLGLAGVLGKARRDTIKDMCQAAEDGLRWIWHKREDQWKTE